MIIALEVIEILVLIVAIAFCFYIFMELVYPFFTFGKVKPGWLFFNKYQEKKKNGGKPKTNN